MTRLDRLDAIVTRLRSRGPSCMRQLAADLGVSVRTVRRDVAILRERGVDIVGDRGRGGGIRLSRRAALPPIRLDEEEVVALVLSLELARVVPALPFSRAAGPALHKVLASLPEHRRGQLLALVRRVQVGQPVSAATAATAGEVDPALLPRFEQAFTARRCLAFRYVGESGRVSERLVEPHGLLLRLPLWYILGFDRHREAPRTFRMDRARRPMVRSERFDPRPALVAGMGRAMGGATGNPTGKGRG